MFLNPHKDNTEKLKLFALLFIVLLVIFGFSNYYFVYKYTQFKGRMKKLNIHYTRIAKVSLFHALVGTIFAFLTFKAFAKGGESSSSTDRSSDDERRSGGRSSDSDNSYYRSRRRHRRRHDSDRRIESMD
jgi:hypothetical protein